MTSKKKSIASHIEVRLSEEATPSYIMCDQIRCISKERLLLNRRAEKLAVVNEKILDDIERCLKTLLGFE